MLNYEDTATVETLIKAGSYYNLYTDYSNKLYLLSLMSTRSQNINTYIQIILTRYIYYDNYDN
jgi:hypothetical protein